MSEFLGPIHYLMYEKIKFQDRLTACLLDQDHLDLLDKNLPPVPLDDLADILDQDNIHGFLSAKIDQVESRLAYAILHGKDIYQKAYALGQTLAPDQLDGPQEVFQAINPLLLDAMPCDQALLASLESQARLQLNSQLDCHEKYAASPLTIDPKDSLDKSCQGDHDHHDHESFHIQEGPSLDPQDEEGSPYYLLRESLLKGFLEKSGHKVQRIGKNFIISWPSKTKTDFFKPHYCLNTSFKTIYKKKGSVSEWLNSDTLSFFYIIYYNFDEDFLWIVFLWIFVTLFLVRTVIAFKASINSLNFFKSTFSCVYSIFLSY